MNDAVPGARRHGGLGVRGVVGRAAADAVPPTTQRLRGRAYRNLRERDRARPVYLVETSDAKQPFAARSAGRRTRCAPARRATATCRGTRLTRDD